jgi:pyruvate/oxaloacetate carboxyltransferase
MMTNLTRQLREVKMEHRLDEILEEVVRVRREYGYPVMATPYSQIVGAQAFENVVSGERYRKVTDESIKYLLGYYGEPSFPLDQELMDRVMSMPRTQEFLDWKPEGYLKSVEELRQEIGPDLSDDDLLLKILIPGRPLKRREARQHVPAPTARSAAPAGVVPKGAIVCGMAGLVLSIQVKVGDSVAEGDEVAMIETMKMRRYIVSPEQGMVKEIRAQEGQTVDAEDVLMVLA